MKHLWDAVFPGLFVTLLGFEALILAVLPEIISTNEHKKWIRGCAIVVGVVLTISEIYVLRQDRRETLYQHEKDMESIFARFTNVDQAVLAIQRNYRAIQATPTSNDGLKRQTFDLSNEILQFLISRAVPPGFGQGRYGEGPYGGKPTDTEAYDKDTVGTYLKAFEPRVATAYENLEKHGLEDKQLSNEYNNPINTYSLRDIAERLTALAEQLPG